MISHLLEEYKIRNCLAWYYTPMALEFTEHLSPAATVYDCMDELSAFLFGPAQLKDLEARLFQKADIVFTGGRSLYEAKKSRHGNIHLFPSSIDADHFSRARIISEEPEDQQAIVAPKLGYIGVIDERLDLNLLAGMAELRPDWQFVMIGPVVKIAESGLPRYPNLHYLGSKDYSQLPHYLSGWNVALMPFAINAATRFISPTKTPEYLAAGKPVISTPIVDVVAEYGENGLVDIGGTAEDFIRHAENLINKSPDPAWLKKVDQHLAGNSWDLTFTKMSRLVADSIVAPQSPKKRRQNILSVLSKLASNRQPG